MNKLDVFILIIIIIPVLFGFKKGFLKSILSLLGIILGFYLALKYYSFISFSVNRLVHNNQFSNIISFTGIFILIYVIAFYAAKKISQHNLFTKTIDKIAGILLGFLKGLILASIFVIIIKSFSLFNENTIKESKLYVFVYDIAPRIYNTINNYVPFSRSTFNDLNPFTGKDTLIKK